MNELQFGRESDIGLVEWNEEEGEDLSNFNEEDGRFLIEFCICKISLSGPRTVEGKEPTIAFHIENDSRRENFVPPVYHPDYPPRVDLSNQGQIEMRETGNSTKRVDECGIWEEVGIECIFLVRRRSFSEEMDNVRDLAFYEIG